MREILKIKAGDRADVRILKHRPWTAVSPLETAGPEQETVAEVVVEFHNGALRVFVHRYEGFDVPVVTHVV